MREANVTVTDDEFGEMGLEELITLGREAGVRDLEELACEGNGAIVEVEVASRYDEARLDELECVDEWQHVSAAEDGHRYVIAFTAPDLPESLADRAGELLGTCDPEVSDGGASMSLVGPQTSISETIREYESAGVRPDLERLAAYEGESDPVDSLTDRQREVIQTAFDMGYYDVPRAVSTEAVADELSLDGSTVSEHLQRAERNLLSQVLE